MIETILWYMLLEFLLLCDIVVNVLFIFFVLNIFQLIAEKFREIKRMLRKRVK